MTDLPLLFLDVDGPLNPEGVGAREGYESHRWTAQVRDAGKPWKAAYFRRLPRVQLCREHGPALLGLPYELVWCTSWNDLANQFVGPAIGLPELPVVQVGEPPSYGPPDGTHWKLRALLEFAGSRPFAWVDDEISPADRIFVQEKRPGKAALWRVEAAVGLRSVDFKALADLAPGLTSK